MLIALDQGNTNLKIGIFNLNSNKIVNSYIIKTPRNQNINTLAIKIKSNLKNIKPSTAICTSVVPILNKKIKTCMKKYFNINCKFILTPKNINLNFNYPNPKEIGSDRLVNSVAVKNLYSLPAIIIDSGTTTTFCILSKEGKYLGGLISPGLIASIDNLTKNAAKLPQIKSLKEIPKDLLNKSTINAIKSGVFYSYIHGLKGIIKDFKSREFLKKAKVILTGGNSKIISKYLKEIDKLDENLTLKGLKIIHNQIKNK